MMQVCIRHARRHPISPATERGFRMSGLKTLSSVLEESRALLPRPAPVDALPVEPPGGGLWSCSRGSRGTAGLPGQAATPNDSGRMVYAARRMLAFRPASPRIAARTPE